VCACVFTSHIAVCRIHDQQFTWCDYRGWLPYTWLCESQQLQQLRSGCRDCFFDLRYEHQYNRSIYIYIYIYIGVTDILVLLVELTTDLARCSQCSRVIILTVVSCGIESIFAVNRTGSAVFGLHHHYSTNDQGLLVAVLFPVDDNASCASVPPCVSTCYRRLTSANTDVTT